MQSAKFGGTIKRTLSIAHLSLKLVRRIHGLVMARTAIAFAGVSQSCRQNKTAPPVQIARRLCWMLADA